MADDAPAETGIEETAPHASAHPTNGEAADAGALTGQVGTSPPVGDLVSTGSAVGGSTGPSPDATAAGLDVDAAPSVSGVTEPVGIPLPETSNGAGSDSGSVLAPVSSAVAGGPVDGGTNGTATTDAADGADAVDAAAASTSTDAPSDTSTDVSAASAESTDRPGRRRGRRRNGSFWRELPVLVVIAIALAVLIRTFLVQAFFIPSGSMEKTLHGCPGCSGDRVLVNKLVYDFHDPRPGDVVVFKGPPSWDAEVPTTEPSNVFGKVARWIGQTIGVSQPDEKDFVKRVIAVGGQTVACCDAKGRVTVNGSPLTEPYIYISTPDYQPQPFGPVTVPAGRMWVMGDHRDGSADSRAHIDDGTDGTVPVSDVIGKAFVIVWPPSRWATLGAPDITQALAAGPLGSLPPSLGLVAAVPVAGFGLRRRRRRHRRAGRG